VKGSAGISGVRFAVPVAIMPCDHTGPQELMEIAERHLCERGVGEEQWAGLRFRFAENHDGVFASVITEIERRGEQWIVVRLDRSNEALQDEELGLREVK
jgi:hypothetical protein